LSSSLLAAATPSDDSFDSSLPTGAGAPGNDDRTNAADKKFTNMPSSQVDNPRLRSIFYMGSAMALHFGGYEFFRNACLALFTSSDYGFQNAAAFPLANALVSPFSLILLWFYSRQLFHGGPRVALRTTTTMSIAVILLACGSLKLCRQAGLPASVGQAIIALTFLFQNSYQYLLYTQHWSFVGSVLTPDQGATWFPALAGCSSLFCSITSSLVPALVPHTGILGLMALTSLTLTACAWCSDKAYGIAQTHGFDPAEQLQQQKRGKDAEAAETADQGRLGTALALFRRVPTLSVLFCEVLAFQSLSTILNVCFVRTLKLEIPGDVARTAYTGRFYGLVNAVSAALQFLVLPLAMKYAEPTWIWRLMPVLPLAFCVMQMVQVEQSSSLLLVAAAVFLCKTLDYSLRTVVYPMVYQPLDFESRYVGKEIIGVFGSRFGKSGMSLLYVV
jgi:hypothetical protein